LTVLKMFCKMPEPGEFAPPRPAPNRNRSLEDRIVASKQLRPIRVEGNVAYVPLTKGYEAVIDVADVPLVEGVNWQARVMPKTVYAAYAKWMDGKKKSVYLHRVLMQASSGMEVDHKDGNGLNNRRRGKAGNLRFATKSQNQCNARMRSDNTSGFRGVYFDKRRGHWRMHVRIKGKSVVRGGFMNPESAAAAYAKASAELHGEFGRLK
jgi:hypothetical protein